MGYWDSSAVVKLYVQELDSAQFRELAVKGKPCDDWVAYAARGADRVSAAGGGRRSPERRSCGALRRVDCGYCSSRHRDSTGDGGYGTGIGAVLEACFSQTPPTFIRTNDALDLLLRKSWESLKLITADMRQRAVAVLVLGFMVPP